MHYSKYLRRSLAVLLSAAICLPALAQDKAAKKNEKPSAGPSEADMAAMMEIGKPGENHKLLAHGVGRWDYTLKAWMNPDPNAPPSTSTGTKVIKPILDGRFITGEHSGKFQMPGPDGKMTDMDFKGMSLEGYDNAKKKFVSTWVDNMGTGIMAAEGTYDAATKTFTYQAEYEMMPGMKTKFRELIKITDHEHHTFEMYEQRGDKEVKTMEIKYTRSIAER